MITEMMKGKRRTGAVVNLPGAGNANALAIMTLSTFASMIGNKTLIIKRLKVRNNAAGNTWLHIGTGVAGAVVDIIPALYSVSNTTDDYQEGDLPSPEVLATLMAYPEAVGGGSFDVQVEVEEVG
jgi:hypothetical protein